MTEADNQQQLPGRSNLPMEQMWPLIESVFAEGGRFRLFPRGTSMLPLLRAGRDSVLLEPASHIRPRDILLYRRPDGQFVLHRLVRATENGLDMRGDNQSVIEHNVDRDAVLARVVGVYRDDTYISVDSAKMSAYTHCFPLYKTARKAASRVKHAVIRH